jgi:hypothetical protein
LKGNIYKGYVEELWILILLLQNRMVVNDYTFFCDEPFIKKNALLIKGYLVSISSREALKGLTESRI